jgi:single-stranded-DNA-specific exonuclease
VKVVNSRNVGSGGDHLKLKLRDGKVVWDAIAFDLGDRELSSHLDIVYKLEKEDWSGRQLLRLNIIDFVPS